MSLSCLQGTALCALVCRMGPTFGLGALEGTVARRHPSLESLPTASSFDCEGSHAPTRDVLYLLSCFVNCSLAVLACAMASRPCSICRRCQLESLASLRSSSFCLSCCCFARSTVFFYRGRARVRVAFRASRFYFF